MRIFLVFALFCLALVKSDDHYFTYPDGKLKVGSESETKIFGSLSVVTGPRHNYAEIDGMYVGAKHMPFALTFEVQSVTQGENDQVTVTGTCDKVAWDGKPAAAIEGTLKITGTWEKAILEATCTDPESKTAYVVKLDATNYECEVYKAEDAAVRAQFLVGEKKEHFPAVQVLNFAYYDYPYLNVLKACRFYLNHFGEVATELKPGYAIVAKDGTHCAVLDKEGDKFIHTHPVKQEVMATPTSMLKDFFRSGYIIKSVPCNGPH